jgi:hypothetical protein
MLITFRCIANRRYMHEKVWNESVRRFGGSSSRLLELLQDVLRKYVMSTSKLHVDDTPVLEPGKAKRRRGAYGPIRVMNERRLRRQLRRCGLPIRRTARTNIRINIWRRSEARCKPASTRALIVYMSVATCKRLPVGRIILSVALYRGIRLLAAESCLIWRLPGRALQIIS